MNTPLITVLIPTYNRATLLKRAINSVFAQTFQDYEIIIVDDASSDETADMVKNYGDPRIRYIKHPINQGKAASCNTAIKQAKGSYIAFLDDDDEWLPKKLEKQVGFIESFQNKNQVVTYTQLVVDDGSQQIIKPMRGKLENERLGDYFFIHWGLMQSSSLLIAHSLLMRIIDAPNPGCHQDWDLCMQLEKLGAKFAFLNEPLTIWYNEERKDRISKNPKPHLSLAWINRYKNDISKKAYDEFIEAIVNPYI